MKKARVFNMVLPQYITPTKHRLIFDAIFRTWLMENPVDIVTVAAELGESDLLEQAGGPAYLCQLVREAPSSSRWMSFARIIVKSAKREAP